MSNMTRRRKARKAPAFSRQSQARREEKIELWDEKRWPRKRVEMPNRKSNRWPREMQDMKLDSFPRFRELPPELRLIIWEMALEGSRIIDLKPRPLNPRAIDLSQIYSNFRTLTLLREHIELQGETRALKGYTASALPPAALFVCAESYNFAIESYSLAFGTLAGRRETWVNFERDFIKIPMLWSRPTNPPSFGFEEISDKELAKYAIVDFTTQEIRDLMFNPQNSVWKTPTLILFIVLRRWINLRKVVIIVPEDARYDVPWIDIELLEICVKISWEYQPQNIRTLAQTFQAPEIVETFRLNSTTSSSWRNHHDWENMNQIRSSLQYDCHHKRLPELRPSDHYLHRENFELEQWRET